MAAGARMAHAGRYLRAEHVGLLGQRPADLTPRRWALGWCATCWAVGWILEPMRLEDAVVGWCPVRCEACSGTGRA